MYALSCIVESKYSISTLNRYIDMSIPLKTIGSFYDQVSHLLSMWSMNLTAFI